MRPFLDRFSQRTKAKLLSLQEYFTLGFKSLRFIFARPFYAQDTVQQMDEIGVKSLGIVLLTGFFTGMVLALQSSVQLKLFGATMYIGTLVTASMIRELGPVLAGGLLGGAAREPNLPPIVINDNRRPAGVFENGTLTLRLRAGVGLWRPEGETGPAVRIEAFTGSP